jgi:hypothetical protein
MSFMEGELQLQPHERVVEAQRGCGARVGRNMMSGWSRFLDLLDFLLGEGTHCRGLADQAEDGCQAAGWREPERMRNLV